MNALILYYEDAMKHKNSPVVGQPWTSLIYHENTKNTFICGQQLIFITSVILSRALISIGAPHLAVVSETVIEQLQSKLIEASRNRKSANKLSKFYEFNLNMITRFYAAQRQYFIGNYSRSLYLLNITNIQQSCAQMPNTKIVTNILSALCSNNSGIIMAQYRKPRLALAYFVKAKQFLAKACTGVQDRDLQLYSTNFTAQVQLINYNLALAEILINSKDNIKTITSIKRTTNNSSNYKFWYRLAQATLRHAQQNILTPQGYIQTLNVALQCFTNSLIVLNKTQPLRSDMNRYCIEITKVHFDDLVMRNNKQRQLFRINTNQNLCYIYLCLNQHLKALHICIDMLSNYKHKLSPVQRLNFLLYFIEANQKMGRNSERASAQFQNQLYTLSSQGLIVPWVQATYEGYTQKSSYDMIFTHLLCQRAIATNNYHQLKALIHQRSKIHPMYESLALNQTKKYYEKVTGDIIRLHKSNSLQTKTTIDKFT